MIVNRHSIEFTFKAIAREKEKNLNTINLRIKLQLFDIKKQHDQVFMF